MKLVVTADLHYNIARSVEPTRRIAGEICGLRADALLVLGDVGGRDPGIVRDCLGLFDRFEGRKLFVAGNHDLWTRPDEDSFERFDRVLPEVCRDAGFHPLDAEPTIVDGVGLVGSIGWYDFSFRPVRLGIPLRFYQAKVAPGAASRLPGYDHLLRDTSDVPESALRISARWMDAEHVHLPISDIEFCHLLAERLGRHLDQVSPECPVIVVGMHHLPFRELVPHSDQPNWAFASAFMGSEMFGEVIRSQPKVHHLFCGHSHRRVRVRCGQTECIDVGCTYVTKRYETLEL